MSAPDWQIRGETQMTDKQRRMLNAVCGDLAAQIKWHGGQRLSKDDWRHLLSGTILGWRMVHGICRGENAPGFVMLGGSSKDLSKSAAADAITCGLEIGDNPSGQGLNQRAVRWCDAVLLGMGFNPAELAA